jgi:3-oxoacyl-[acyl-carrier protein] reductase
MELKNVSFAGKTGIVTGAAQGIGKAIAKQFVAMGGKAIIVDRNQDEAAKTCQELGNADYYIVDLADATEVVRVFKQIVSEQGHVDVLINNAGILSVSDFDQLTNAEWDLTIAVNLTAVFLACQVIFRHMTEMGGGRIVNVASIAGKVGGGYLGTAAYAAAKAGVISLSKSIAKAGSSKNIYCNSLCPSYTKTPLVNLMPADKEQKVLEAISLHRAASSDEVANAVLFLASDVASYIQGENLNCDGGMLMNG